jgi:hypothetical protein
MDLTQVTADQLANLNNEELADVRERAAYNATIIENRTVVSDGAHRMARHLRSLHHAAEREIEPRRTQSGKNHGAPATLEGFIAFAELFPAEKTYNWVDCDTCLVAAYARSLGLEYAAVSRTPIPTPAGWTLDEPFSLDYLALMAQPHTYGAALDFARSLTATAAAARAIESTAP